MVDGQLRTNVSVIRAGAAPAAPLPDGIYSRLEISLASHASEMLVGWGNQPSFLDLKNQTFAIVAQENGVGRGDQPLSAATDLISPGTAGTPLTSYSAVRAGPTTTRQGPRRFSHSPASAHVLAWYGRSPRSRVHFFYGPSFGARVQVPAWLSSDGHAALLEGYDYVEVDATAHDTLRLAILSRPTATDDDNAPLAAATLRHATTAKAPAPSWADLAGLLRVATGTMDRFPTWPLDGFVVGVTGGTDAVRTA
eukprot:7376898-Prymnesium_polylepis.1